MQTAVRNKGRCLMVSLKCRTSFGHHCRLNVSFSSDTKQDVEVKAKYIDPHPNQAVSKSYVAYLYVDYYKEIGARVIRSCSDKQKAIEFAESISTKYISPDDDNVVESDKVEETDVAKYSCHTGTLFDAGVKMDAEGLIEAGILPEADKWMWVMRVGVDEVNQC